MSTEEPRATSQSESVDAAGALMKHMLADGHLTRREVRYADAAPAVRKRFSWFGEMWLALTVRVGFIVLRVHLRRLR